MHDVIDFRADDFVSPGDISVAIFSDCKESTKVIAVVSCVGQLEGTGRLRMRCAKGPCFRELVQLLKFPRLWIGGSLFFKDVLIGTISTKTKTRAVYDEISQVNRLFQPAPKFFETSSTSNTTTQDPPPEIRLVCLSCLVRFQFKYRPIRPGLA